MSHYFASMDQWLPQFDVAVLVAAGLMLALSLWLWRRQIGWFMVGCVAVLAVWIDDRRALKRERQRARQQWEAERRGFQIVSSQKGEDVYRAVRGNDRGAA